MRRIHTTFDLLEAHALTAMLHAHGIDAWLFDADFVRQDWFKAIAYGGYRVVVNDAAFAQADELLRAYRSGTLALMDAGGAPCPACARAAGVDDPQPRRNVFLAMIFGYFMLPLLALAVFFLHIPMKHSPVGCAIAIVSSIGLYLCAPWFIMRYFKWRWVCTNCGHHWRDPPRSRYADLSRLVQAASGESAI